MTPRTQEHSSKMQGSSRGGGYPLNDEDAAAQHADGVFASESGDEELSLEEDVNYQDLNTTTSSKLVQQQQQRLSFGEFDQSEYFPEQAPTSAREAAAREERATLAKAETKAVSILRVVTLLVLVVTSATISVGTWYLGRDQQTRIFRNEFEAHGQKVLDNFYDSVDQFLGALDALGSSMTSFAMETEARFPNVTIPDFEVRAGITRISTHSTMVNYFPLVTDEDRAGWEAYATANQGHLFPSFINEVGYKRTQDAKYPDHVNSGEDSTVESGSLSVSHTGFSSSIWGTDGEGEPAAPNSGPYLPMWHMSPTLPVLEVLNFNALDLAFFRDVFVDVLDSGKASLGAMSLVNDPDDEEDQAIVMLNAMLALGQFRHGLQSHQDDPVTFTGYPVFDSFDVSSRSVVGVLGTAFYWRLSFQDVLPPSVTGVVVVVRNSEGQVESFRIDGASATYLGHGDRHDPTFSEWELAEDVTQRGGNPGPETRSFTAVDLSSDVIGYSVHVYPSQELEEKYVNWTPILFGGMVAVVFLFTTAVFLLYNFLVERRQKVVMDQAIKSGAIISNLFPRNVRDRLLEEEDQQESSRRTSNLGSRRRSNDSAAVNQRRALLEESNRESDLTKLMMSNASLSERDDTKRSCPPIADLFQDSTIFFADLAGFTRWSSDRRPTEVFGLLETIYGAFDRIATRRQVFKVETIGDCYVAVTGVPESQEDHALIMVKFAISCVAKLGPLLRSMAEEYGEETNHLALRVGIHSGPVTAGVLRGDRSRFQLFGDTVNTAARMESNGEPGCIHCSEATATCLRKSNRGAWLIPREKKITPKGKREMQTYWIRPPKRPNTALTVSNHSSDF